MTRTAKSMTMSSITLIDLFPIHLTSWTFCRQNACCCFIIIVLELDVSIWIAKFLNTFRALGRGSIRRPDTSGSHTFQNDLMFSVGSCVAVFARKQVCEVHSFSRAQI